MTFVLAFSAAFIFWAFIWWLAGWCVWKIAVWKHQQYADKHFKQTERFRRGFTE